MDDQGASLISPALLQSLDRMVMTVVFGKRSVMEEIVGAKDQEFVDRVYQKSLEAHSSPEKRRNLAEAWKVHIQEQGRMLPGVGLGGNSSVRDDDDDLLAAFGTPTITRPADGPRTPSTRRENRVAGTPPTPGRGFTTPGK